MKASMYHHFRQDCRAVYPVERGLAILSGWHLGSFCRRCAITKTPSTPVDQLIREARARLHRHHWRIATGWNLYPTAHCFLYISSYDTTHSTMHYYDSYQMAPGQGLLARGVMSFSRRVAEQIFPAVDAGPCHLICPTRCTVLDFL